MSEYVVGSADKAWYNWSISCYYISITLLQSYTGKHHEFVAVVLLWVWSTSNNSKGDKRVICFWYSFVAMVMLILSYKCGISLHIPLPMNVANRVTIACLVTLFHFWFPTLHVSSTSNKHWGEKPWVRG